MGDQRRGKFSSERVLQLPINACAAPILVANIDLTIGSVLYSAFYSAFFFFFGTAGVWVIEWAGGFTYICVTKRKNIEKNRNKKFRKYLIKM